MLSANHAPRIEECAPPCPFLQISSASLEVPVIVLGLSGEFVTLRVKNSLPGINPESLHGLDASLRLAASESQETVKIPGTLALSTVRGIGEGKINLALKLAKQDQMTRKILENLVPHSAADQRSIWEHWEQAKISQVTATSKKQMNLAALWALGGVIFKLVVPKSLNLLGDLTLFLCGLMGTIKAVSSLRQKKHH